MQYIPPLRFSLQASVDCACHFIEWGDDIFIYYEKYEKIIQA